MDNLQGQGDGGPWLWIWQWEWKERQGMGVRFSIKHKAQIMKVGLIWFKPSKGNYEAGSCICTQSSEEWSRNHCHVNGS